MNKSKTKQPDRSRRSFLTTATGAGALGALALLSGSSATAEVVAKVTPAEPVATGYRETEHIRQYYRSARYW
jgi:hypothetical protein